MGPGRNMRDLGYSDSCHVVLSRGQGSRQAGREIVAVVVASKARAGPQHQEQMQCSRGWVDIPSWPKPGDRHIHGLLLAGWLPLPTRQPLGHFSFFATPTCAKVSVLVAMAVVTAMNAHAPTGSGSSTRPAAGGNPGPEVGR